MGNRVKVFTVLMATAACLWLARPTPALDDKKGETDQQFVREAASAGMAEVKLGKMATERAASADVKRFGQRMVDDHTKANNELARIAEKKGIALPKEMDKKHQAAAEEFSKLKGADFDRHYKAHMVKDHMEAVKLFEAQAKDGKDADLKAFAEKTLPTLKEHLEMARKLADNKDVK